MMDAKQQLSKHERRYTPGHDMNEWALRLAAEDFGLVERRYTAEHELRLLASANPQPLTITVNGDVELQRSFRGSDDNTMPHIRGYAALFDISYGLGWYREIIRPGAFKESLANGDDVRALFNHNPDLILGRSGPGTLRVGEDDKGLWYDIEPPDTQVGRDLIQSVKRGDINQSSFAFSTIEDDWHMNDGEEERILIRVKLWDVSPVTYPANPETSSEVAQRSHAAWKATRTYPTERAVLAQTQRSQLYGKLANPLHDNVLQNSADAV